jgi:hypothetical protein
VGPVGDYSTKLNIPRQGPLLSASAAAMNGVDLALNFRSSGKVAKSDIRKYHFGR